MLPERRVGVKAASVDAGFLKSEYQGQIIALVIRDDNNKILPVATAIVDKEDENNYFYFLRNCMKSPTFAAVFNTPEMTFFSDGHLGFPPALARTCHRAKRRRCLQHYLRNAPAIGSDLLSNVYDAARASTRDQFDKHMRRVKDVKPNTFNYLMSKMSLDLWTHHASDQDTRVGDVVTSNDAESLFNMIGDEMVPLKIVEALVDLTASRCAAFSRTGAGSSERFTPYAVTKYEEERKYSNGLLVKEYGGDTFKVENVGRDPGSNTVDLKFNSDANGGHVMRCTCGFCTRHDIPYRHVLAAAKYLGRMDKARELTGRGYNAQKYRDAYANSNFLIRPPSLDGLEDDPSLLPSKIVVGKAGRRKGKRKRKRAAVTGETNTSSVHNEPQSAPAGSTVW